MINDTYVDIKIRNFHRKIESFVEHIYKRNKDVWDWTSLFCNESVICTYYRGGKDYEGQAEVNH